jgi:flavin-dependent dehydrogenase
VNARYDVVIVGGGLAGLTLAIQLRQQLTALQILVLE